MPKVHFAMPGRVQRCPKSAACWSPAIPAIGIAAPRSAGTLSPTTPAESTIAGSIARGTPNSAHSSSLHAQPAAPAWAPIAASIVRDAFEASVACTRPPVRFHSIHASMVPAASSPRPALARAPGVRSRIHANFDALK